MKHLFKASIAAIAVTASIVTLSSFKTEPAQATISDRYVISKEAIESDGANQVWIWKLYNPNPGNGQNGTLQDVSHWSLALTAAAEAALVSAEYSLDGGITWISVPLTVDRDPSIRQCTGADVLKFDVGTTGTEPILYRVVFNQQFSTNAWATSYIKTGSGLRGCNMYFFEGIGGPRQD